MSDVSINKSYSWAINTCNASDVGYSTTYRNQRTVNGITYYDCSSFIWYALKAGGWELGDGWPFTTYTMGSTLTAQGFTAYTVTSDFEWKTGDIGWKSSHTEMCYLAGVNGEAVFMGAHTDRYSLAEQVSISSYANSSFTVCYRYGDGGAYSVGASTYVCAAMAGNFWQESGIDPGIWQGLSAGTWTDLLVGYGLGQWTNTGGDTQGRLYQLHAWLSENGYADDSGDGQCGYIIAENVWYSQQEAADYASLTEFLNSTSTDLEALTHAWNIGWEGIHDSSWDERVEYAQRCLTYIQTHANDSSITAWITGNRYLSTEERLNNAVMLYRYFGQGGGGGGTPASAKKKMPVWMWIKYHV